MTRVKTSGRKTALLASPICIGQVQGEEKHKKGGAKALSLSFLSARALSLSLSLSPARWHAPPLSSLHVFGLARPHALRMDSPAIF